MVNGYHVASLFLVAALIIATMAWGRAWLAWPLAWKVATAVPLVAIFAWLGWRGS